MDQGQSTFLRIVEAGSLRAAAEQLGADPSAVSRRLVALEEHLGVKLVHRSTRRSTPTEAGSIYYEGLRRLADDHAALESAVVGQSERPRGLLRIAAPLDFGARFVTPVMETMRRDYPELAIEVLMGSEFENLIAEGIDVAVRIGKLPDSSLIGRKLADVPRVMVASRGYLDRRGIPGTLEDLADHDFIFYARRQAQNPIELIGPDGSESVTVSGGLTINSVTGIRHLVDAGHGIHVGPLWAFRDGISSGELVALLPHYRFAAYPLHVLYRPGGFVPAKIQVFIKTLEEQLRANRGNIAG